MSHVVWVATRFGTFSSTFDFGVFGTNFSVSALRPQNSS
jgi:hypothetical protein